MDHRDRVLWGVKFRRICGGAVPFGGTVIFAVFPLKGKKASLRFFFDKYNLNYHSLLFSFFANVSFCLTALLPDIPTA